MLLYYSSREYTTEIFLYRLNHGFRWYLGNIPEVLIAPARGQSLRVVAISTEGIPLYTF